MDSRVVSLSDAGRPEITPFALLIYGDHRPTFLPVEAVEDSAAPEFGGELLELLAREAERRPPRRAVGQRYLRDLDPHPLEFLNYALSGGAELLHQLQGYGGSRVPHECEQLVLVSNYCAAHTRRQPLRPRVDALGVRIVNQPVAGSGGGWIVARRPLD